MARIVGIDLGTTNSLVAHVDAAGRPEIIPNAAGNRLTPSASGIVITDVCPFTLGVEAPGGPFSGSAAPPPAPGPAPHRRSARPPAA